MQHSPRCCPVELSQRLPLQPSVAICAKPWFCGLCRFDRTCVVGGLWAATSKAVDSVAQHMPGAMTSLTSCESCNACPSGVRCWSQFEGRDLVFGLWPTRTQQTSVPTCTFHVVLRPEFIKLAAAQCPRGRRVCAENDLLVILEFFKHYVCNYGHN